MQISALSWTAKPFIVYSSTINQHGKGTSVALSDHFTRLTKTIENTNLKTWGTQLVATQVQWI